MKKLFLFIITVLIPCLLLASSFDNKKISPYTAAFLSSVKDAKSNTIQKSKVGVRYRVKQVNSIDYVNAFIDLNENANIENIRAKGAIINTILPQLITAQLPVDKIEEISALADVQKIQISIPVHHKMNKARVAANVDKVQAGTELSRPYFGKDVVVGILDNGFEYGHIGFYNQAATESRLKRVWNQNLTGTAPSGFSYGTEYTTTAQILAAQYDSDSETHGTHVAGIAAGGDRQNGNTNYGIASEADLVFVSMNENDSTTDNVSLADGIKYIYDYATSVSKPCVVNMSLGSHIGPHDGTSGFDQACDAMQGKGRLLVGAAGNEGADNLHISETFSTTTSSLKTFFKFSDSSQLYGQTDIWGEVNKDFTIRVIVYKKSTIKEVYATPAFTASTTNGKEFTLTSTNGAVGKIYVYTERNSYNLKPNAYVVADLKSVTSGNYIGLEISSTNGTVHAWADDYYSTFTGNSISGWKNADSNYSIGEIGGTGKSIISVGAFTTCKSVINMDKQSLTSSETVSGLASFSSKGPTPDGRVKPDITAPGTTIISCYSSAVLGNEDYADYFVNSQIVNGKTYYYGAMDGTSMSTPFVTGVLATWLEANPNLTPDDVRAIFKKTAKVDTYTGTIPATGSNSWGFGKIDAWAGIKECIKTTAIEDIAANKQSTVVFPSPASDELKVLFLKDDSNVKVNIIQLNGQPVYQQVIGTVSTAQEIKLDVAHLPKGIYIVTVNGNNQHKNQRVILQ